MLDTIKTWILKLLLSDGVGSVVRNLIKIIGGILIGEEAVTQAQWDNWTSATMAILPGVITCLVGLLLTYINKKISNSTPKLTGVKK